MGGVIVKEEEVLDDENVQHMEVEVFTNDQTSLNDEIDSINAEITKSFNVFLFVLSPKNLKYFCANATRVLMPLTLWWCFLIASLGWHFNRFDLIKSDFFYLFNSLEPWPNSATFLAIGSFRKDINSKNICFAYLFKEPRMSLRSQLLSSECRF